MPFPIISYPEAVKTYTASELQAIGNSLDRIARKGYFDLEGNHTSPFSSETYRNSRNFWAYAKQARRDKQKGKV